ncbi:MAG TPA: hypothetical protein VGK78_06335 [Nocardioides sp.]|uniref:hypothetical protein n=1 Tax=Nocardioides sp. TaxID=35761 RepID=UPI002F428063
MNILPGNMSAFQLVAEQTINDRIRDAERRAQVRAVRAARRDARRAGRREESCTSAQTTLRLPAWAFRFVRPAH